MKDEYDPIRDNSVKDLVIPKGWTRDTHAADIGGFMSTVDGRMAILMSTNQVPDETGAPTAVSTGTVICIGGSTYYDGRFVVSKAFEASGRWTLETGAEWQGADVYRNVSERINGPDKPGVWVCPPAP